MPTISHNATGARAGAGAAPSAHFDSVSDSDSDTVRQLKLKRLVATLNTMRGSGTSVITLAVPPASRVHDTVAMLNAEMAASTRIKSRSNRMSVQAALTAAITQVKRLASRLPENGVFVFCGEVKIDVSAASLCAGDGCRLALTAAAPSIVAATYVRSQDKIKRVAYTVEPPAPVLRKLYLCDARFHTEDLEATTVDHKSVGFVVIDGHGALLGTVTGERKEVLHQMIVTLPSKHRRGGQSAPRFARLRHEARHRFVKKVCELCTKTFVDADNCATVDGIVLAGLADFKDQLRAAAAFPAALAAKVLAVVDTAYGGLNGFNQAVGLAGDVMGSVALAHEQALLRTFFRALTDVGPANHAYGPEQVMRALEFGGGAVDTLLLHADLELLRVKLCSGTATKVLHVTPAAYKTVVTKTVSNQSAADGVGWDVECVEPLLDYLLRDVLPTSGAKLELLSDATAEGTQFVKGFGGIAAMLRFPVDADGDDGGASDADSLSLEDDGPEDDFM